MKSSFLLFFLFIAFFCPDFACSDDSEYARDAFGNFDQALGDLRSERDRLLSETIRLKAEMEDLNRKLEFKSGESEAAVSMKQDELDRAYARIEELQAEKADLNDRLKDAQMKLENFGNVLTSKDSVFMDASDENKRLKKNVTDLETVLQRSAELIQKLKNEKEALERELDATESRLMGYYSDREKELALAKKEQRSLAAELDAQTVKLKSAEKERDKTLEETRSLRAKLDDEAKKSLGLEASMKRQILLLSSDLDSAKRKAESDSQGMSRELKEAGKTIEALENKKVSLERMIVLANEKLAYYEDKLARSKDQRLAIEGQGADLLLRQELDEKEKLIEGLKAELRALGESHRVLLRKYSLDQKQQSEGE